jgi:hypothetical protein
MFAMTRSTRILLCRLGCIAFCVLPTGIVGGWVCWRSTARFAVAQRADWERELSLRLGLKVQVERVNYPAPAVARLERVRLLDPSSRRCLAAADAVEVVAESRGWRVELWQPRVQAADLPLLAGRILDRVLGGPQELTGECRLTARELSIAGAGTAQSLLECRAHFAATPSGPQLAGECRLPEAGQAARPMLISVNSRQWTLDTSGQALPCDLLAEVWPGASRLGKSCRFVGTVSHERISDQWSAEVAGRLGPLDLDALVTEQFPHQLSGQATLDIERLAVEQGRLAELRGTLRASHGTLSRSLIAAARDHLQLNVEGGLADDADGMPVPYQRLAIGFELSGRSLSVTGQADPTRAGVVADNTAGIVAEAPPGHSVAAVNLIRMLLPQSDFQVPAARQTAQLVGLLPLPDAATHQALPHTPTRLSAAPAPSPRPVRQPAMR